MDGSNWGQTPNCLDWIYPELGVCPQFPLLSLMENRGEKKGGCPYLC